MMPPICNRSAERPAGRGEGEPSQGHGRRKRSREQTASGRRSPPHLARLITRAPFQAPVNSNLGAARPLRPARTMSEPRGLGANSSPAAGDGDASSRARPPSGAPRSAPRAARRQAVLVHQNGPDGPQRVKTMPAGRRFRARASLGALTFRARRHLASKPAQNRPVRPLRERAGAGAGQILTQTRSISRLRRRASRRPPATSRRAEAALRTQSDPADPPPTAQALTFHHSVHFIHLREPSNWPFH